MAKKKFPEDFEPWQGNVPGEAQLLISHPVTRKNFRLSMTKFMSIFSNSSDAAITAAEAASN